MDTSRRSVLGAVMAAPLLAQFTGAPDAVADDGSLGTVSEASAVVRWTPLGELLLGRFGATVSAVEPATLGEDGKSVRFPVASGEGDPSLVNPGQAHGNGRLAGGVEIRVPEATVRVTELQGFLRDGVAWGTCVVNGLDVGHKAAVRPGLDAGVLQVESVPLGKPMKVKVTDVPLRPTPELVAALATTLGTDEITVDSVLAQVTAEGVYTPPAKR
ncbi:hypothetical protein IAG44_42205 [Streptomyces roseirectus]|uniref:Uncharacterized protein n=1 Tax=Streptomyces roseirectus TaxID=2768066 RepID=A0A7H0IRF5_9ACTN|nr:hypothetical protein [Streptomyces roseirectus]QNP75371.1 hypothetical protein IAG44_42205 [Streptomyces roseirectus]